MAVIILNPSGGTITQQGFAPAVVYSASFTPTTGTETLTGYQPTVTSSATPSTSNDIVVSQVAVEYLVGDVAPSLRASQLATEFLIEGVSPPILASQIAVEVLLGYPVYLYASQIATEVLIHFPTPIYPKYSMSDIYLPTLAGLTWNTEKTPQFSTTISKHTSGREARSSNYAYPLWQWDMSYEVLRESNGLAELETLCGFFLQRYGQYDTFLFIDPSESNAVQEWEISSVGDGHTLTFPTHGVPAQVYLNTTLLTSTAWSATATSITFATAPASGVNIGLVYSNLYTGDGLTTQFQLTKNFGGFVEPVGYVDIASLEIVVNGQPVFVTSSFTFSAPNIVTFNTPPANGATISFNYNWAYRVRFDEDAQNYNNFMFKLWELKKLTLLSVKP